MIQEERVKQMTKLAIFEEGEGKKYIRMTHFFRKDYIGWEMVKSFVFGTLAFLLMCFIAASYGMGHWIKNLAKLDIYNLGTSFFMKYLIFMLCYFIITYMVYSVRYKIGRKKMKQFYSRIKKVRKLYEQEERGKTKEDWE